MSCFKIENSDKKRHCASAWCHGTQAYGTHQYKPKCLCQCVKRTRWPCWMCARPRRQLGGSLMAGWCCRERWLARRNSAEHHRSWHVPWTCEIAVVRLHQGSSKRGSVSRNHALNIFRGLYEGWRACTCPFLFRTMCPLILTWPLA